MTEAPVVRLELPARPEGVGVVRQALVGVADGLALDGGVLADAKMAVTEACTNAVVHAYDQQEGLLEVEMLADEDALTVVVRDRGSGIQPRPNRTGSTALGLGLPLIAALSDAFEVRGGPGIGTEVRMTFRYERGDLDPVADNPITGAPGPSGRWDPAA
jgi:anti-sigma regulatory factor (Ser/Thr protein kinase)